MNIETNNELARIVKSDNVKNTFDKLNFISVDPNSPEEIIRATFQPVKNSSHTTVLPLLPDAIARKQDYVKFDTAVQPIVIEFDKCGITTQKERARALAGLVNTPVYSVFSGNKSIHTYVWFKNFSSNPIEYKRGCESLISYLASTMPDYFQTEGGSDESLIPDYDMFESARYCRQAGGINEETGNEQTLEEIISIEDCQPMDLSELIGEHKIPSNGEERIIQINKGKEDLSGATFRFLKFGSMEGSRDNDCFKAACDLRDCAYSVEEAFSMLNEGAEKCNPAFPVYEVERKIESAYSYDIVNNVGKYTYEEKLSSPPYAFIEQSTGSYHYLYEGEVYPVTKQILKDTFGGLRHPLPDPYPVLKFKYDVHDNFLIDELNRRYNLFNPTKYMRLEKTEDSLNPNDSFPTIDLLLKNLIPIEDERDHFMNWFASAFNTLTKQTTAWVLKGPQGSGKSLFFSNVIKPLFGDKQAIKVEDEDLRSSFNGYLKNVCFICFNEVANNNTDRNSLNSKIKAIVTDSETMINEKNIKTYIIENYVNCIFFSNEKVPLLVESDDRRFNIVETGGKLTALEWFDRRTIVKLLECELPRFAQYLKNYEYDEDMAMSVINTEAKRDLVDAGVNRYEDFANHLKAGKTEWFIENINHDDIIFESNVQVGNFLKGHIKLEGKIEKDLCLSLFKLIYLSKNENKIHLAKKLKLYGIRGRRIGPQVGRTQFFSWHSTRVEPQLCQG